MSNLLFTALLLVGVFRALSTILADLPFTTPDHATWRRYKHHLYPWLAIAVVLDIADAQGDIFVWGYEGIVTGFVWVPIAVFTYLATHSKPFLNALQFFASSQSPGVVIGKDERRKQVTLSYDDELRERGICIVGLPGTGKSTLAVNIALQDILHGNGSTFFDPHKRVAENLLKRIPKHRVADCLYFDADLHPLPFNVLATKTESDVRNLASDLARLFSQTTHDVGDSMYNLLRKVLRLLVVAPNTTFLDIHEVLRDPSVERNLSIQYKTRTCERNRATSGTMSLGMSGETIIHQ